VMRGPAGGVAAVGRQSDRLQPEYLDCLRGAFMKHVISYMPAASAMPIRIVTSCAVPIAPVI
jgi:hypothetical protein